MITILPIVSILFSTIHLIVGSSSIQSFSIPPFSSIFDKDSLASAGKNLNQYKCKTVIKRMELEEERAVVSSHNDLP